MATSTTRCSPVLYKSKYGASKQYAEWIAEDLNCIAIDVKNAIPDDLENYYDTIILGGGLYANSIAGASLIVKKFEKLKNKNLIFFSVGITPLDCRDYYDKLVIEKTFPENMRNDIKVFNFLGKMLTDELTMPHKAALKMLKGIMQKKENPTEMEKMLVDLCDYNKSEIDRKQINDLVNFVKDFNTN